MKQEKERLTVRFDAHTKLKLDELTASLSTSYSMLIRTMVQSFIIGNEEQLNRIIDKCSNYADN